VKIVRFKIDQTEKKRTLSEREKREKFVEGLNLLFVQLEERGEERRKERILRKVKRKRREGRGGKGRGEEELRAKVEQLFGLGGDEELIEIFKKRESLFTC